MRAHFRFLFATVFAVFLFAGSSWCHAHDPGFSAIKLFLKTNEVTAEMVFSRSDIESFFPIDLDHDGKITPEEFAGARERLAKLGSEALLISLDGVPMPTTGVHVDLDNDNNCSFVLTTHGTPTNRMEVESRILEDLPSGHRQFVSLYNIEKKLIEEKLFTAKNNKMEHGFGDPRAEPASPAGFALFFEMGVEHILTGYDHLLFLFGLLIVCTRISTIAKVVTCFTVAHSITLAMAVKVFHLSPQFVEPAIALSIVYVGVENIIRSGEPRGRALLTFCFGLIHGFGFASALAERHIGENGQGIVVPLLSFNLGVEAGQIAVACVALPIIWQLRKKEFFVRRCVPALSCVVALAGLYWFVQRVWF